MIETGLLARLRALWRGLSRPGQLDAEMDDEMRFHVDMQAERLVRERGLDAPEARRQALVAFGGLQKFRSEGRRTIGLHWVDAIVSDSTIAVRMLRKFPGLTAIGAFAMAVAIAIGAVGFEGVSEVLNPVIPTIQDGDRLVAIQFATDAQGSPARRVLRDFVEWREGLTTVEELSAFRTVSHYLGTGGAVPDPVRVAEVTASTFDVARTPPLMGRYLLPQDETPGATPVLLIGHSAWQTRFAGDAAIVGRIVQVGAVPHTVVGVMPEGFHFPVDHQFWMPLRLNAAAHERLQGPSLSVFGRLRDGATLERAQAELTAVGQRTANAYPDLYSRLHLTALPYPREHVEIDRPAIVWSLRVVQSLVGALLIVVAANLAILVYARTVTRLGEIAVRSALGASRRRLLMQLFIEALALSLVGTAAGLMIADVTLSWARVLIVGSGGHVPFWITLDLSATTVAYAIGLAIVAAVIVGVLPGLQSTGRRLHVNLRTQTGGTGRPLGGLWTTLIVTQVAVASAVLPLAIYLVKEVARMEFTPPAFPAGEFLLAHLDATARQREIITRLESEPGIAAVAWSSHVPGYEGSLLITVEGVAGGEDDDTVANVLDIGPGLFEAYEAKLVAGRAVTSADAGTGAVMVNRAFAEDALNNADVLGRRLPTGRPASGVPRDTIEIVGIVDDFPKFPPIPGSLFPPTIYRAAPATARDSFWLTIRFRTAVTADAIARVRQIAADVEPITPLRELTRLTEFYNTNRSLWRFISFALVLVTASVLLLSAGGIYAMMSFTVAQRTREIGIRSALGANSRRILAGIFARVLAQLSVGLAIGLLLSGTLIWTTLDWQDAMAVSLAVGVVILIVGLVAAIGPARRGLGIQVVEALRTDA
jgi:putative ABC transport system permease protein